MWILFTLGIAVASLQLMRAEAATREANRQSQSSAQEANRFFSQARDVVDHFGVSLSGDLAVVPDAERARLNVLRDTLRYYRAFIEQVGDNPSRKPDLASTQLKIARIAHQLQADSEAIPVYQQAEKILSELPDQAATSALAANSLGLLLTRRGDAIAAEAAFQRALAYNERDIANGMDTPVQLAAKHRQAITMVNRAHALEQLQRPEQAIDQLWAAEVILKRLESEPVLKSDVSHALTLDKDHVCVGSRTLERGSPSP